MEKLSIHTVESWVLDYHEGQLSEKQANELRRFLKDHPDLGIDPDFNDFLFLSPSTHEYPHKGDLYKSEFCVPDIPEDDYMCIAAMEGDLNDQEQSGFQASLSSDPDKAALFDHYLHTRLKPGAADVFAHKELLVKKTLTLPGYWFAAVSAAAALIISFFIFLPEHDPVSVGPLLTADTTREIIYMDKLVHPSEFEQIVHVPAQKEIRKVRVSPEDQLEQEIVRDDAFTHLARLNPSRTYSLPVQEVSAGDDFVHREVPAASLDDYKTFLAFSADLMRKNVLRQDPDLVRKSKFSLWELADVGLEKVSNMFSLNADLKRQYDEKGKLVEVSFESPLVAFTTPIAPRQPE